MKHSQNNSDDDLIAAQVTGLRDSLPNASVESRLQLRMRRNWEATCEKDRKSARPPNKYKSWLVVSAAAALLVSTAIILFQKDKQIPDGLRRDNAQSVGVEVEFNLVHSKETDPCNILPPLADWRS